MAGIDIDPRIKTTVDNLADVFRATDVAAILKTSVRLLKHKTLSFTSTRLSLQSTTLNFVSSAVYGTPWASG